MPEGRLSDQAARSGEPITDRIVSLFDPDARPIRKGKLGKPNEFGYVSQLAEVTENTKPGARGLILPASTALGSRAENALLPGTVAELERLGISPGRSRSMAGSCPARPTRALEDLHPRRCSSRAARSPAPNAPNAGCGATEPAPRAGSATSNAATGWTEPPKRRPGPADLD